MHEVAASLSGEAAVTSVRLRQRVAGAGGGDGGGGGGGGDVKRMLISSYFFLQSACTT